MKLILWTMYFGLMALSFTNAVYQFWCYGINLSDENFMKNFSTVIPKVRWQFCMYECILSAPDMVETDGMIKSEKLVDYLTKSEKYNDTTLTNIEKVLVECKKHSSGDKCNTVGLLVKCSVEKAEEIGLSIETFLTALRSPFISMIKRKYIFYPHRYPIV